MSATDPTLAALEAELRDPVRALAPAPRVAWAAELDRRVAAGFPRRARPARRRAFVWAPAAALAACALLALVIALPHNGSSGPSSSRGSTAGAEKGAAAPATTAAPDAAAPSAGAPSAASPFRGRQVERSTQLTVGVRAGRLQSTAQRVYAIVGGLGGIVDSSSVSSGSNTGSASFELRIPAASLDRGVTRLAALGRVRSQTSGTQDITASFTSVRERLRAAEAERSGILRALEHATTQTQIDALKQRRRLADSEITGLRRERAALRRRTSYGRVTLELQTAQRGDVAPPPDDGRWTPGDALRDAGGILSVAAGVAILLLALGLPLALAGALGWGAARPWRRRRREAVLGPV